MNAAERSGTKRGLDIALSLTGLCLLTPAFLIIGLAVKASSPGPVLFRQPRPGRGGRLFTIVKFRTMSQDGAADTGPLRESARLTGVGRFLRRASLDELPELWNVLKGEMSLVGPRPLLVEYLERYSPEQARRHEVLPGITGLAQVSGRNGLSWDEKLALDVHYVDHRNPWLDLSILMRTVTKVVRREGVSAAGHATAPKFTGGAVTAEEGKA